LWFDHRGKAVSVVAGGDEHELIPHADIKVQQDGDGGDQLGVDPTGHYNLPSFVPVDSKGTKWVGYLENDTDDFPCQTSTCNNSADGYGVYPPGGINWGNFDTKHGLAYYQFPPNSSGIGCEPWAWITQRSWVCSDGQNIGVVTVVAGNMLRIRHPVPSVGGRVSYDPVLSPDHTQIAFQSCRAGACGIYTVPVAGGTLPKEVSAQTAGALIAWLP
jgi:hypothetical protein